MVRPLTAAAMFRRVRLNSIQHSCHVSVPVAGGRPGNSDAERTIPGSAAPVADRSGSRHLAAGGGPALVAATGGAHVLVPARAAPMWLHRIALARTAADLLLDRVMPHR